MSRLHFSCEKLKVGNTGKLSGDEFLHAVKVTRHKVGDELLISDNTGIFACKIVGILERELSFKVMSEQNSNELDTKICAYVAVLKADKNELVVQKLCELGIKKIVFFQSKNTVGEISENKRNRLEKIAQEAIKQCGRSAMPELEYLASFSQLLSSLKNKSTLFAYELAGKECDLKKAIADIKTKKYVTDNITCQQIAEQENNEQGKEISFVIGAEGGFTNQEAQQMTDLDGVRCVSLGKRIFRAETASIYLASILAYEFE